MFSLKSASLGGGFWMEQTTNNLMTFQIFVESYFETQNRKKNENSNSIHFYINIKMLPILKKV